MSDFGRELAAVNWLQVALFAAWILPVPKIVELNLRALFSIEIAAPVWFIKVYATIHSFLWPIWLLKAALSALLFPKPK